MQKTTPIAAFVHIPKTGGASIRSLCRNLNIDIIKHNLMDPDYVSLKTYKKSNSNVYCFAVVRNPWDRLVSAFYYLTKGGRRAEDAVFADQFIRPYTSIADFIKHGLAHEHVINHIHFRPQFEWVFDKNMCLVNKIGRLERIEKDLSDVFRELGLPYERLPHINRSLHKNYKHYFCNRTRQVVAEVYRRDIEVFEYEF